MLNLLFLSPHCDPEADLGEPDAGGQCVYEHQLAQALTRESEAVRITTFCRQTDKRPDRSLVNERYTIERVSAGSPGFVRKEELEGLLQEFVTKVLFQVKATTNLVVHGHYWDGGKAALAFKALAPQHIPLIWTPHSLGALKRTTFQNRDNEAIYNFIPRLVWENYTIFAANRLVVSSPQEKELLKTYYALEEDKAQVVPPGIDIHHFSPQDKHQARAKLNLPQDKLLLLTLGRMEPTKGYHHALEAVSVFKEIYKKPFELHIFGGSSTNRSSSEEAYMLELQRLAKSLEVEEVVVFHPAVPYSQVNQLYAASDIFLMLSDNEPFGFTLLEAMAMQTAAIASHTGGSAGIIGQNRNGVLVNVNKPAIIATNMRALAMDDEYRQTMAEAARQTVVDQFSWEAKAKGFLEVYEHTLSEPEPFPFPEWTKRNYFLAHNLL